MRRKHLWRVYKFKSAAECHMVSHEWIPEQKSWRYSVSVICEAGYIDFLQQHPHLEACTMARFGLAYATCQQALNQIHETGPPLSSA
ncbi:MAG: hypothetical protein KF690_12490 [Bacteroidetes bacterium]|nr:hypothetical protein [Bacteroidota bacterium]